MKNFKNLTPHQICLNDGTVFDPSGIVPRVSASFSSFDENGICLEVFGKITGLPEPEQDTLLIVSAMVLAAAKENSVRNDLVAPATGHPECVRNDKGQIVSVPGFVK